MKLRTRLALSFALVALGTGGAVALAAPIVVQQGFQQLEPVASSSPTPTPAPTLAPAASPSDVAHPSPGASSRPATTARPSGSHDGMMGPGGGPTSAPSRTATPTHHPDWTSPPNHDWTPGSSSWPDSHGWSGANAGALLAEATASSALAGRSSLIILAVARPPVPPDAPAAAASSPSPAPSTGGVGGTGTITTADVTRDTTLRIVLIAIVAALVACGLGFLAADRLVRPLRRLQSAASAVAAGDLAHRSGLADRTDEIGDLGRSFDSMAHALEVSESSRKRFLQDAVHELRTPITVIEATTSAMIDGVYQAEPKHLETIRSQARLLSRIVDDLRTISLAEAGVLELRREPTEVASTLRRVAEGFHARADAGGITLGVEAPEAVVVDADPEKLRQVLGSLLDNAIRHTPEGGQITLAASTCFAGVRFDVRDSGPGVAAEDLPHVFERFYQADPSRDRARGSSGLGLAIVKALAEAHGGAVGVENAPRGGADFWIQLPA